jgi:hypothetical protein
VTWPASCSEHRPWRLLLHPDRRRRRHHRRAGRSRLPPGPVSGHPARPPCWKPSAPWPAWRSRAPRSSSRP